MAKSAPSWRPGCRPTPHHSHSGHEPGSGPCESIWLAWTPGAPGLVYLDFNLYPSSPYWDTQLTILLRMMK